MDDIVLIVDYMYQRREIFVLDLFDSLRESSQYEYRVERECVRITFNIYRVYCTECYECKLRVVALIVALRAASISFINK